MRMLCRIGVWLAVALGAAACRPAPRPDRATQQLLLELDGYTSAANMYVARKLDQMDALGKLARSTRDPLRRYELEMNIAREFFAFSFDSTQLYLKHFERVALEPGESRTLTVGIPVSDLAFVGLDGVKKVEPGEFQLWVAGDSASGKPVSFEVK